jgi:hypothetical protein
MTTLVNLIHNGINIGDDIQSIAQQRFLTPPYDFINREHMHTFSKRVRVIMSAWFLHSKGNWPPSNKITPIFVSFHIAYASLASQKFATYYKKYEPIGCRDLNTMKLLQSIGVKAYFSGCLTLTLIRPNLPRNDMIYVVDAHLTEKVVYPFGANNLFKALIPDDIKSKAEYIQHDIPKTLKKNETTLRHEYARLLLEKYATAKLVITSRLHCLLPCLAYGTPVIFLENRLHTCKRYSGYHEYIHGYHKVDQEIEIDWDTLTLAPRKDIKPLVANLLKDIEDRLSTL